MLLKWSYLLILFLVQSSVGEEAPTVDPCSCHNSCLRAQVPRQINDLINLESVPSRSYFYDSKTGSCALLPSSCALNTSCSFESNESCVTHCGAAGLGRCKDARFGCCPDGSPRSEAGDCNGLDHAAHPDPSQGRSIRWNMVAIGSCVLVLLLAVLVGSGITAYHYKQKQKEKLRSRYIHSVLEMYESDSESTSSEVCKIRGTGSTNSITV